MKNCLCCGAECASDAPHCLACGEASFDVFVNPATALEFTLKTPFFAAPDGAGMRLGPTGSDNGASGEPTGEEPPEALQEPNDPIPGVAAAPAKRGPGRPKKDAPN